MFRRETLAGGLAFLVGSVVLAQESAKPLVPEDALTPRELIAWSSLQTPRPAQERLSAFQNQTCEPNQDSAHRLEQPTDAQAQQERPQSHSTAQAPTRNGRTPTR
jgi:hypothetical protein